MCANASPRPVKSLRSNTLRALLSLLLLGAFLGILLVSATTGNNETSNYRMGGALTLTKDGQTLLAVNPDSNTLSVIDTTTLKQLAEIPVGLDPRWVVLSSDDTTAFVANQGSDSLSIVDLDTLANTNQLIVGDRPVNVTLSPNGYFLAIAEFGGDQIRFLDARDFSTLSTVDVGDRPHGLAFTPDGRQLIVTHLLSGNVSILLVQPFRNYFPLIQNFFGDFGIQATLDIEPDYPPDFVQISTWPNVAPAPSVLVNSAGTRAYLPQTMANGLGMNVQFDTTVFPKVSVLDLETYTHQTSEHISLPEIDQPVGLPWGAALAKGDTELWVANAASNDVSVIDISNPTKPLRLGNIPVGANPRGIVLSPDRRAAYVNNTIAGTVSVIDTSTYTVTSVITSTKIPLPPLLLNGKRLFHSSAVPELSQARWIACNTCHIEGEHDGRTWQLQFLGEAPIGTTPVITRNTTSLLGMIQTYPLRWSAEWDESADSEFAIRFEQFGSGLIGVEFHPTLGDPNQGRAYNLDSLAAYIDSLQVPVHSPHPLTSIELRGKEIFESQETKCLPCHPPPYYTDFQTHNVGTADSPGEWFGPFIDTPTLRFLYDSAPYLHNGSASTLYDLLTTANPDDQHGVTSQLTLHELDDLIAFLLALPFE